LRGHRAEGPRPGRAEQLKPGARLADERKTSERSGRETAYQLELTGQKKGEGSGIGGSGKG